MKTGCRHLSFPMCCINKTSIKQKRFYSALQKNTYKKDHQNLVVSIYLWHVMHRAFIHFMKTLSFSLFFFISVVWPIFAFFEGSTFESSCSIMAAALFQYRNHPNGESKILQVEILCGHIFFDSTKS